MKLPLIKVVGTLLLAQLAWADAPVPASEYPWPDFVERIQLQSIPVHCGWRQGRPFVPREQVARILKLSLQGESQVDLIEALSGAGWTVEKQSDGTVVARPPLAAEVDTGGLGAVAPVRESDESLRAVDAFMRICAKERKVWVKHHPQQGLVDSIGADLARQARRPIPWTFAIIQERQPNAACTGEGMVYITTGLLKMLDRDELAGVLAHEVAHGVRQQIPEDRVEQSRRRQTGNSIDSADNKLQAAERKAQKEYYDDLERGASPEMARSRRDSAVESARSSFNFSMRNVKDKVKAHENYEQHKGQTDERQADLIGMRLAMAAGYQPDGLVRALEKLQAASFHQYGQSKMLGAPTHPPIAERIRALRGLLSRFRQ